MREIRTTSHFERDLRRMIRRGKDVERFKAIRARLIEGEPLDVRYRDHPLRGAWIDHRECHIESDWLLVYRIEETDPETLVLVRTGTHADLFE